LWWFQPLRPLLRILKTLKEEGFVGDLRPKRGRRAAVLAFPDLIEITEKGH